MTNTILETGTIVKLVSDDRRMTVVGYDSVGSVICERSHGKQTVQAHFAPVVLALADDPANHRHDTRGVG